jgi:hypothetical protein
LLFGGRHLGFSTSGLVEKYLQVIHWFTGHNNLGFAVEIAFLSSPQAEV